MGALNERACYKWQTGCLTMYNFIVVNKSSVFHEKNTPAVPYRNVKKPKVLKGKKEKRKQI